MNHKIRLGILGGGGDSLIGGVHRIAANMFDRYQLIGGCFNPNAEENKRFAQHLGLADDRIYASVDALIAGEKQRPM